MQQYLRECFDFRPNLNVSLDETKRNSIQQKLHGQAISGDHGIGIFECCLLETMQG